MADRFRLIDIFKDTQKQYTEDPVLQAQTKSAKEGTRLYPAGYRAELSRIKADAPDIRVVQDTTYHCAQAFAGGTGRTAVLNFANAYTPGGGVVHGATAQEECLCRSSNLYAALTTDEMRKRYYDTNYQTTDAMGTDAVIFTPGVTVFKSDDTYPVSLETPFQVDVLTCAAPYCGNIVEFTPDFLAKLRGVFTSRIRNILEAAKANDADILVLGAFGCGAFLNPPDLVAEVFRNLLIDEGYGKSFKTVLFAIKANNRRNTNYLAFAKAFEQ